MNQPQLFPDQVAITIPKVSRGSTIQERFEAFHRANPHVYAAYRSAALQLVRQGITQYGIAGLTERLRWDYAIQTKGEPFKICNDFRSRYARLLAHNEPELKNFFEFRQLREKHCEVES